MKRVAEEIDRYPLLVAYMDNMVQFLVTDKGINDTQARLFVSKQIEDRLKVPMVSVQDTSREGFMEEKMISLDQFIRFVKDKILTPSGSVYYSLTKKISIVNRWIFGFKAERSAVKKRQFKASASKQYALENILNGLQNSIKIALNSIPGAYGSAGSIFYDRGCYNAVTSSGRLLISYAFLCCEQLLAGNIAIFNEEEAINLLLQLKRTCPPSEKITETMSRYNLKWASKEEVCAFINDHYTRYVLGGDLKTSYSFMKLLDSFSPTQLQYAWYHGNFKHVCFYNEDIFKPWLKRVLSKDNLDTTNIVFSEEEFWKCSGGLMSVAATILTDEVKGRMLSDIVTTDQTTATKLMAMYNRIRDFDVAIKDLISTFIITDMQQQHAMSRNPTQRESVVGSDTDSVIFTVEMWSSWFTDHDPNLNQNHSNISALMTYLLNIINDDEMAKFAISCGAVGSEVGTMQMKSEFGYTSFLLFDTKKMYAALTASQEGVQFETPRPDIKGTILRGQCSLKAKKKNKEFLIKQVLTPVVKGNISGIELIKVITNYESEIKESLKKGELEYVPLKSVGTPDRYKNVDSSDYFYLKAWNALFGPECGMIRPPDKLPTISLGAITKGYIEWLSEHHPLIHKRLVKFIADHGKAPTAIMLEGKCLKIPEAILPIVDIRSIVYASVSPCYVVLSSMNIHIGHPNENMLLGDIYEY